MARFDMGSLLGRFIFAMALVLATYNPSGYSYVHWVKAIIPNFTPYVAIVGVVLVVCWVIYIRATMRSLGTLGMTLLVALCACVVWLLFWWGLLSKDNTIALRWVILICVALVLSIGISWSHIRRRLTGQLDVDDVDED